MHSKETNLERTELAYIQQYKGITVMPFSFPFIKGRYIGSVMS